jgi:serine O-acetyltransferase
LNTMGLISTLKEDVTMFRLVRPKEGLMKYFYFPDFRTVVVFRISAYLYRYAILRPLAYLLTLLNDLVAGVWIGPSVSIGPGLYLGHPRGLVINPDTVIGTRCAVMHRVTIGGPKVVIGNNVEINAGASIISNVRGRGMLTIGSDVIIAAGAVVLDDVTDGSLVAGMPAIVKKKITAEDNWVEFRKRRNREGF